MPQLTDCLHPVESWVAAGFELEKRQPVACLPSQTTVLHQKRGFLRCDGLAARASFSLFCTHRTPQVFVHLGERSICSCTGIGGSFAPHFICKELGPSADSAAAAYSASRIHSATSSTAHEPQIAQVQRAVKDIQGLFTAHDAHYFSACNGRKEYLHQGCDVCCLTLLPCGLISAFLGTNPAVVLHAEPQSAAEASESPTERTGDASGWEKPPARLVAWPLGAPEAFMRHVELKHAGREKLDNPSSLVKAFGLYHLKDFAYQPPHDDVVAVVWGTPSFWAALSVDAVCSLIAAFVQTQETQEEDASLFLQEEAADFLLRKALVQAVVKREKTVKELLHHPAALRAAGLPHWEDPLMEAEQRAALGNKKAEIALMRRVIAAQEEYLKRKSGPFRFAKQPFFDSDMGVLVLLFNPPTIYHAKSNGQEEGRIPPVQPRFVALALSGSHFSSTRERGPPEAPIVGPLPPFPEVFSPMAHRLRAPFCFSGSAQGVVSGLRGSSGACCELVERKNLLGADQGETSPFFLTRNAVFLASALSCGCPSRTAGPHCCGFAAFATATSDPLGASGRAPPSSRAAGKGASESDANAVSKGQRVGEEGEALQQAVEEAFCVFGVIYRHAQKAPSSARSATSAAASPAVTSSSASTQTTAPAESVPRYPDADSGVAFPYPSSKTKESPSVLLAALRDLANAGIRTPQAWTPPLLLLLQQLPLLSASELQQGAALLAAAGCRPPLLLQGLCEAFRWRVAAKQADATHTLLFLDAIRRLRYLPCSSHLAAFFLSLERRKKPLTAGDLLKIQRFLDELEVPAAVASSPFLSSVLPQLKRNVAALKPCEAAAFAALLLKRRELDRSIAESLSNAVYENLGGPLSVLMLQQQPSSPAIEREIELQWAAFTPAKVSAVLNLLAKIPHRSTSALNKLGLAVQHSLHHYSPNMLAGCLSSLDSLSYRHHSLLSSITALLLHKQIAPLYEQYQEQKCHQGPQRQRTQFPQPSPRFLNQLSAVSAVMPTATGSPEISRAAEAAASSQSLMHPLPPNSHLPPPLFSEKQECITDRCLFPVHGPEQQYHQQHQQRRDSWNGAASRIYSGEELKTATPATLSARPPALATDKEAIRLPPTPASDAWVVPTGPSASRVDFLRTTTMNIDPFLAAALLKHLSHIQHKGNPELLSALLASVATSAANYETQQWQQRHSAVLRLGGSDSGARTSKGSQPAAKAITLGAPASEESMVGIAASVGVTPASRTDTFGSSRCRAAASGCKGAATVRTHELRELWKGIARAASAAVETCSSSRSHGSSHSKTGDAHLLTTNPSEQSAIHGPSEAPEKTLVGSAQRRGLMATPQRLGGALLISTGRGTLRKLRERGADKRLRFVVLPWSMFVAEYRKPLDLDTLRPSIKSGKLRGRRRRAAVEGLVPAGAEVTRTVTRREAFLARLFRLWGSEGPPALRRLQRRHLRRIVIQINAEAAASVRATKALTPEQHAGDCRPALYTDTRRTAGRAAMGAAKAATAATAHAATASTIKPKRTEAVAPGRRKNPTYGKCALEAMRHWSCYRRAFLQPFQAVSMLSRFCLARTNEALAAADGDSALAGGGTRALSATDTSVLLQQQVLSQPLQQRQFPFGLSFFAVGSTPQMIIDTGPLLSPSLPKECSSSLRRQIQQQHAQRMKCASRAQRMLPQQNQQGEISSGVSNAERLATPDAAATETKRTCPEGAQTHTGASASLQVSSAILPRLCGDVANQASASATTAPAAAALAADLSACCTAATATLQTLGLRLGGPLEDPPPARRRTRRLPSPDLATIREHLLVNLETAFRSSYFLPLWRRAAASAALHSRTAADGTRAAATLDRNLAELLPRAAYLYALVFQALVTEVLEQKATIGPISTWQEQRQRVQAFSRTVGEAVAGLICTAASRPTVSALSEILNACRCLLAVEHSGWGVAQQDQQQTERVSLQALLQQTEVAVTELLRQVLLQDYVHTTAPTSSSDARGAFAALVALARSSSSGSSDANSTGTLAIAANRIAVQPTAYVIAHQMKLPEKKLEAWVREATAGEQLLL
ncbi:hypothetical protein cyc_06401 [Cyclospora cayetanensis]|uniref:Uncharacterized protein n=1 Tax=Cyclospora cayetanensis TaxID=88456 RepID=A0A1D3D7G7_9EIME|nr:hypothetical protein cyc_06401 [Cyclospora cayetanensis]